MATAVLLGLAVLQVVLPNSTELPRETELAPRRVHQAAMPSEVDYPAVLANPIFAPDRKPDATAVPVAGGMMGFTVLGIAIAGDTATAVVKGPGGMVQRIKPGEVMNGWKLVTVELSRLTFERSGERRILAITKTPAPAPISANGFGPGKKPLAAGSTADSSQDSSDNSDDSSDDSNDDDNNG